MNPDCPPVWTTLVMPTDDLAGKVESINAYCGNFPPGHDLEGRRFVVVAWRPTPSEIEDLKNGGVIYLSMVGGLLPHSMSTSFSVATYGTITLD